MNLIIRNTPPLPYADYSALESRCFLSDLTTQIQYNTIDPLNIWYGTVAGELAALLIVANKEEGLHIGKLASSPDYRRRGFGRQLLLKAREIAQSYGVSRLSLSVLAKNTPARALYEGFGFEYTGSMKRYLVDKEELKEDSGVTARYDALSYIFPVEFFRNGDLLGSGFMNTEIGGIRDLTLKYPDINLLPALYSLKHLLKDSQPVLYYLTGDAGVISAGDALNIKLDIDILKMEYAIR